MLPACPATPRDAWLSDDLSSEQGKEVSEMWTKTIDVIRAVARWVERLLEVNLPMGIIAGLHTR